MSNKYSSIRKGCLAAAAAAFVAFTGPAGAADGFPGQIRGAYGVVKIANSSTSCTGFMISKRIVATAAHCVLFSGDTLSTKQQLVGVTYTLDGTNYFCISGGATTSSGECATRNQFKIKAAGVFPFNKNNDFAIIYRTDTDFSNIGDDDALGIRTDSFPVGFDLYLQARGGTLASANDHRMRLFGPAKVTDVQSGSITIKATFRPSRTPMLPNGVWVCDGDSGGPALFFDDTGAYAEGVAVSFNGSGRCAANGNEEYFYHMRTATISLINGVISREFPVGFPQCTDLANFGITVPGYYYCNNIQ